MAICILQRRKCHWVTDRLINSTSLTSLDGCDDCVGLVGTAYRARWVRWNLSQRYEQEVNITWMLCTTQHSNSLGHFGQHSPGGVTRSNPPQSVIEKQGGSLWKVNNIKLYTLSHKIIMTKKSWIAVKTCGINCKNKVCNRGSSATLTQQDYYHQ